MKRTRKVQAFQALGAELLKDPILGMDMQATGADLPGGQGAAEEMKPTKREQMGEFKELKTEKTKADG